MDQIIQQIRQQLQMHADDKTRVAGERFFKENVKLYGIKAAIVAQIEKEIYKELKAWSKSDIFQLCEILWKSGYMEEAMIACKLSVRQKKEFLPEDFSLFERWINEYITNWATCDTFCNHTVGEFVMKYPQFISSLKTMAHSPNRWMRRASAVSLIVPARKGMFLPEIFEIAQILLLDPDDLVQKGYGWLLKVASQTYQNEVFQFVYNNRLQMPRTALRYAIEKMPDELRVKAMER